MTTINVTVTTATPITVTVSGVGLKISSEQFTKSDLSGSDLTCTVTPLIVMLEREVLHLTTDYTVSGKVITFVVSIPSTARITVWGY